MSAQSELGKFFAGLLMAIGALIAFLCGSCTLLFGGGVFVSTILRPTWSGLSGVLPMLPILLVVGVLPTVFGVLVFLAGQRVWRRSSASDARPSPPRTDTQPPAR